MDLSGQTVLTPGGRNTGRAANPQNPALCQEDQASRNRGPTFQRPPRRAALVYSLDDIDSANWTADMAEDLKTLIAIQDWVLKCRRLASETSDPESARQLFQLADKIEQRAREVDAKG